MQKLKKIFYFMLGLNVVPFLLSIPYAYILQADNLKEFWAYWFIAYFIIYLISRCCIKKIFKSTFRIDMRFMV